MEIGAAKKEERSQQNSKNAGRVRNDPQANKKLKTTKQDA